MATKQQAEIFRDKVLPKVGEAASNGKRLGDKKGNVTGFLAQQGCLYSRDSGLMVVGQAPRGWEDTIDPVDFNTPERCAEHADELLQQSYPQGEDCPMTWVTDRWGANGRDNTRLSPFWRVVRRVTEGLAICLGDEDWSSHLIWSNLYKVAPADGRKNPNNPLCDAQFEGCKELLQCERQDYCPRHLLFLTENPNPENKHYWARPFLDDLELCDWPEKRCVRFTRRLSIPDCPRETLIVGAVHPRGQNEDEWVKEVLGAFGSM